MKRTSESRELQHPAPVRKPDAWSWSALHVLLVIIIVYVPYAKHFHVEIDVKGLNVINMMFALALAFVLARKSRTLTPTPLKWHFIAFFAVLTWGCLVGQGYDNSTFSEDITALKTIIFYMLFYFLYYHAVQDVKTIHVMFRAILFVTFLVSLQAIRQALDYGIATYSETKRASGPFAADFRGANLAAAYFVMFVPLFFAVFQTCKSRPMFRLVALFCTVLGVFGAFFTFSRQAYFILAFLFLIQTLRRSLIFGVVIAIAVLSYDVWAPTSVTERIQMTEQSDGSGEEKLDSSTESRFLLWQGAMQLIGERPWGIGMNHFKREIGRYVPAYKNMDAHNGYVLMTTEIGIFGVTALIVLLVGLFRLARKVDRLDATEDTKLFGGAYTIAVLAVALSNLFGSRWYDGEVMGNFWILTGLVARYYTLQLEARNAGTATAEVRTEKRA